MKRLISLILTLCLLLQAAPWAYAVEPAAEEPVISEAMAEEAPAAEEIPAVEEEPAAELLAEEYTAGTFTYTINDDGETATITGSTTQYLTLEIPAQVDGYTVTAISSQAFANWEDLMQVIMPDTITSVGSSAFFSCEDLVSVDFSESLTLIGASAFQGCLLKTVFLPDGLTTLSEDSFRNCDALTEVSLPDTLAKVQTDFVPTTTGPFYGCDSLNSVTFRGTWTSVPFALFAGCTGLKEIALPETVTTLGAQLFKDCAKLASVTLPDGLIAISARAFEGCDALTAVTIPDAVTTIESQAFNGCGALEQIYFSGAKNLTTIGASAFQSTGLTTLTLPDGLTTLSEDSFRNCDALTEVSLPDTLAKVQTDFVDTTTGPFYGCDKLNSVTFRGTWPSVPFALFAGCTGLKEIALPETVTTMGAQLFKDCANLASVTLPDGLTAISVRAFEGCDALTAVSIPDAVTTIESQAFNGCGALEQIYFSGAKNLTTIGASAFQSTGLTTLTLPDGLTTLSEDSFRNCDALTEVSLPDTLAKVQTDFAPTTTGPFYGCDSLNSVTFRGTWTSVPFALFAGCTGLKEIALPETVTTMGAQLFKDCANLASVTLPDGLTAISARAFEGCTALTAVSIPDAVTTIESQAFNGCGALARIYFSDAGNLTKINESAFFRCGLTELRLPEGLTSIGEAVAKSCTALEYVSIPSTLTRTSEGGFESCTALKTVEFAEGFTTVARACFRYCSALEQVVFPESLTAIKDYAFNGCTGLTTAYFEGDAPSIELSNAFPTGATLYYMEDRAGWTTPYYPGEALYPTCPIWGSLDPSDEDYFAKLADHHFKFLDHLGNPLTDVTVVFGEELHASGQAAEITARFADDAVTELTFRKDGYYAATLPLEVLEGISVIRLYPDTWTKPFIQAAYAREAGGTISDLLNGGILLTAGDTETEYEFYILPNWAGQTQTTFTMSPTPDPEDALTSLAAGWHSPINITASLQEGSSLFLLQQFNGGDGTCTELKATVMEGTPTVTLGLSDLITWDNLKPDEVGVLSQFDLGIDLTDELDLDLKVNSDGTFKGVLGVTVGKYSKKPGYTTSLEDYFHRREDEMKSNSDSLLDIVTALKNNTYEFSPMSRPKKLIIQAQVLAIGYVEGYMTRNEYGVEYPYFTKVGLGAEYTGKVGKSWQFFLLDKPHYASLVGSLKTGLLVNFAEHYYGEVLDPQPTEWSAAVALDARYGLGWDGIATAGVRGNGSIQAKTVFPVTSWGTTATANLKIYAEAAFFCLSSDVVLLELNNLVLSGQASALDLMSAASDSTPQVLSAWEPQSMDYLNQVSLLAVEEENTDATVSTLASGVYPYAEAELAVLPDGTELAVWVAHGDNEPNNRTRLYYSYTADGLWTAPAPVDGGDLTADFSPLLQVENGTAYLVWQNAARPLTDSDDVVSMASVMDLSAARFNGTGFDLLGTFGTDAYDGAMSLTTLGGRPAVVWASNESNDVLSGGGLTSSLCRACWDGEDWTTETLAQGLGSMDQTAACEDTVWFTADVAGQGNPADRELYRYDGSLTRLTEDAVIDSKPAVVDGRLVWFRNESLTDGETEIPMEQVTDRYQYLSKGAMEALVYVVSDSEQRSGLYASFNDGSGWGEAIALTDGTTNIGSFSARFLADGSLAVLALERTASLTEENTIAYSAGTLNRYQITIQGDLTLSGADYAAATMLPNNELAVQASLTNSGMVKARAVLVTVADGETVLTSQARLADLASGESGVVSLNVPLGETVPESLTVTVEPIGFTDATENTCTLTLNRTDLSLEEAVAFADGSQTTVTVMAANRGQTVIDSAELILTDSEGNELARQTVSAIAARSAQFVTFTLDQALADKALLTIRAHEVGAENLVSNNETAVLVTGKAPAKFAVSMAPVVTDEAVKVTVTLSNTTEAAVTGTYVCAAYGENGQMLACFTEDTFTTDAGQTAYVGFTLPKNTAKVRLFRLNGDYSPVDTPLEKEIVK